LPDINGLWTQDNGTTRIAHIKLNKNLSLGPIHTEHQFVYQTWDNDRILRPNWIYQGKLYFGFRLFKKRMETRWGIDAYVVPPFNTPTFWPVLGDFGPAATATPTGYNFLINPHVNLKVDQFYIFIKATNFLQLFNQDMTSYWTTGYLNYPDRLRFGVRWTLLD